MRLFPLCAACILLASPAPRAAAETFTVFAAASLGDALREIGGAYEKRTGDKPRFNFAGSSTLARQIDAGAPADLFVSADEAQMDLLEKKQLIDPKSRRSLLGNTLVVVTATDGPSLTKPADLATARIRRIATGNPQAVPVGVYARQHLEKLGLWEKLRRKIVPTEHVRAALAAAAQGNADAAIVYQTDAASSHKVKVAFALQAEDGPRITYPAALVKGGHSHEAAARFLTTLAGAEAAEVFRKHGFTLLEKP